MMTLNEAIREIQENETLSAAARNALHGATKGHPWCNDKDLLTRKNEVLFAIGGRMVHMRRINAIERAES